MNSLNIVTDGKSPRKQVDRVFQTNDKHDKDRHIQQTDGQRTQTVGRDEATKNRESRRYWETSPVDSVNYRETKFGVELMSPLNLKKCRRSTSVELSRT